MPKHSRVEFEQPFRLEHDGLTQSSVQKVHYTGDLHGPTRIEIRTHLPPFVLPSYWADYDLSEKDVYTLADFLPAQLLWLSCLVHGAEVKARCIKPSFARVDEVLISHRALAIRTLIEHQKVKFTNKKAVLDTTSVESLQHMPPLPSKEVHESIIPVITRLLFPRLRAFDVCRVPGLFEWKKKLYLPVKLEGDAIFLQRATKYENYTLSQKKKRYGFATIPFVIRTPDGETYALIEDGLLISAKQ